MFGIGYRNKIKDPNYLHVNERLSKQLDTIQEISKLLISGTFLDDSLEEIVSLIPPVLGVNYIGIVLLSRTDGETYEFNLVKTSMPKSLQKFVEVAVGKKVSNIPYIVTDKENLFIKSINSRKIEYSKDIYRSFLPIMSIENAERLNWFIQSMMKLLVSIPLIVNEEVLGVIALGWKESEISMLDQSVMSTFANQVSIAIYNANLFTQVQSQIQQLTIKNRDLQSLFNLTTQISKSLDPEEVAQTAVNSLPQDDLMIGAVLSAYDREKGEVYVHSLTQNSLSYQVEKIIGDFRKYKLLIDDEKYKDNLILKAVKYENIQSSDKLSDMLTPVFNKQIVNLIEKILQIKSVVVYPVRARGEIIGTITYLLKSKNYTELGDNEKQLFETFTNQISIALENANLFTQQKLTQRELQRTLKELNERRRFEQDMIDVMGHELRTPMSIVRNALSFMEMELKNKGQIALDHQQKYVQMGLEAARREVNLIETLLSATKSEGKGFQLILEKVNLVDVVNNSIMAHSPEATKKNLTIKLNTAQKELFVYADKTRTQEISDNFLSNAIKYTEKGGVEIDLYTKNNLAYISVKDTGVGISEEDIKKLGQKFFRAQQYTDEEQNELNIVRPGGTGLGLFVSFSLIKVMDGDLQIESKVGVGSTFTFGLPVYTNQARKQLSRNASEYKTDIEN